MLRLLRRHRLRHERLPTHWQEPFATYLLSFSGRRLFRQTAHNGSVRKHAALSPPLDENTVILGVLTHPK